MNWDLEEIGNRLANATMYDVKQAWRAARNYALNVSEIEAKVDEATNDDPWGASTSLMAEIAQATHNYADFGEIMQAIYRRFMEKEASEWRQIYKSLTLLEYLVKNGAERVVDDARSHVSTIKILRNFHYIDEKGKDQGINVRNRAKEIAELLSDVERIRAERRKARANRNKYQGTGNSDFVPGSGAGRYGGFSSEQYYSGGVDRYPSSSGPSASAARQSFDEYDAGDNEDASAGRRAPAASGSSSRTAPPKAQPVVQDLFSFDDEPAPAAAAPAPVAKAAAPAAPAAAAADDFDDFQAAPPSAGAPAAAAGKASGGDVFDFLGGSSSTASTTTSAPSSRPALSASSSLQPTRTNTATSVASSTTSSTAAKPANNNSSSINFDDLWATSAGKPSGAAAGQNKGKMSMAELARNQSANSVWGSGASKAPMGAQTPITASTADGNQKKDIFDLL